MKITTVVSALAALLLLFAATRCAKAEESWTFRDIPARKPMAAEVTVTSRIADAETVRGICYMRAREMGATIRPHPTAPACSWREADGRIVILWSNAQSFNNKVALESGGHELFHWHEVVDHE